MSTDPAAPYHALADLIERELLAVARRDLDALAALKSQRAAIVRSLPARPPGEARAALTRCERLQGLVASELERSRDEILSRLRRVRQGRRVVGGYAPARPVRAVISTSA